MEVGMLLFESVISTGTCCLYGLRVKRVFEARFGLMWWESCGAAGVGRVTCGCALQAGAVALCSGIAS